MKILVVDDDPSIVAIVTQFLASSKHHTALPAWSAQTALEAISKAEEPFDCFLIDIQMPQVDGIALTRMIRETPGYATTPIIMVTAMQDRNHLDQAFTAGATDYVAKPFDYGDLQRRLHEAQLLSLAKTRQRNQPVMAGEFKGMGDVLKEIPLDGPVPLGEVKSAIEYAEFDNYVRQLIRRQLFKAACTAVKIEDIDRLYAESTTAKFASLIRVAATAVEAVLLADGGVLSYRGAGAFLCIPQGRLKFRRDDLQARLNQRHQSLYQVPPQGVPRLVVGEKVALGRGTFADALDSLARAVDSLDDQPTGGGDLFGFPGRLLRWRPLTDERRKLEKRAFEFLLRDTLEGPDDDAWQRHLTRRESAADNR